MLRYLLIISAMSLLNGCAEMKIIGNAAMRDLRSDAINVEQTSYRYHQKLVALNSPKSGVLMAKAELSLDADSIRSTSGETKKRGVAKSKKVKGLWEKN